LRAFFIISNRSPYRMVGKTRFPLSARPGHRTMRNTPCMTVPIHLATCIAILINLMATAVFHWKRLQFTAHASCIRSSVTPQVITSTAQFILYALPAFTGCVCQMLTHLTTLVMYGLTPRRDRLVVPCSINE